MSILCNNFLLFAILNKRLNKHLNVKYFHKKDRAVYCRTAIIRCQGTNMIISLTFVLKNINLFIRSKRNQIFKYFGGPDLATPDVPVHRMYLNHLWWSATMIMRDRCKNIEYLHVLFSLKHTAELPCILSQCTKKLHQKYRTSCVKNRF